MNITDGQPQRTKPRIKIEKPVIRSKEAEQTWREIRKFAKLIPTEAEPNLGRVREIKQALKEGEYLTPEMIEETAAHVLMRFMRKD